MTPDERINTAFRAKMAWDEFMAPMIAGLQSEYMARMAEVANSELARDKRADKITALSNAVKILGTLEAGMLAMIRDGEVATADKVRAEKIEQMTKPQRRLLNIAAY